MQRTGDSIVVEQIGDDVKAGTPLSNALRKHPKHFDMKRYHNLNEVKNRFQLM